MQYQFGLEKTQFVAPMTDFCHQWQQTGEIQMDWYFELVEKFGSKQVLFNSVQVESDLFKKLNEKSSSHHLTPNYVITTDQFCEISDIKRHLEQGVRYTVLIYSSLSTELSCKVEKISEFLPQLSFVILARKDWNVRNCFRSVPHFMRSRLFVDFPVSLHITDPFYSSADLTRVRKKFDSDFVDGELKSFCPDLGLHNEWGRKNISHFSTPRKLSSTKPKISIISLAPEKLKALENCRILKENPESFEILITRVAGQKTKVIPKIKSVTSTRYWAHPIDPDQKVSEATLANFTATQADGETLLFLDQCDVENLDSLLNILLSGSVDMGKLLARKKLFVFEKVQFFAAAGFDDLIETWSGQRIRMLNDCYSEETLDSIDGDLCDWIAGVENSCDRLILAHRYAHKIEDFGCVDGQASIKERRRSELIEEQKYRKQDFISEYKSLFKGSLKTIVGGHLAYLLKPIETFYRMHGWKYNPRRLQFLAKKKLGFELHEPYHMFKMHAWKLNPLRIRHIYRQHFWKLNPLRMRHFFRQHLWKFNPFRVRHFFKRHLWRVNPRRVQHVYRTYAWRVSPMRFYHFFKQHFWRLNPSRLVHIYRYYAWRLDPMTYRWAWWFRYLPNRIYWFLFRVMFPVRKVYYFSHFQYEKRVLGLHKKQNEFQGY